MTEGSVVNLVNKEAEESGGFVARVGTQLGVNLNDECGGHCGEETGLVPVLARVWQNSSQN